MHCYFKKRKSSLIRLILFPFALNCIKTSILFFYIQDFYCKFLHLLKFDQCAALLCHDAHCSPVWLLFPSALNCIEQRPMTSFPRKKNPHTQVSINLEFQTSFARLLFSYCCLTRTFDKLFYDMG